MTSVDERAFGKIAAVDSRYWASLFFGLVLAYVVLLVVEAVGYSSNARLFPIVVGVPLAVLIVVQIVLLLFRERLGIESVDLFESIQQLDATEEPEEGSAVERNRREFEMILWSLASFGLIWLFGHLVALVAFVFGFIYVYERNLRRALIATAITFGFVYVLFVSILGASLWSGVVGGWL
ncbi:MAG: tripartite tricarboxylate transporter TctB family protein [Halanaeroarchaeum sp.]